MALPQAVNQTIQQIIAKTPDVTDDLHQVVTEELQSRYEEFVRQIIASKLPFSQAAELQHILDQPEPNTDQLEQLVSRSNVDVSDILDQAHQRLKEYYLG
jgi:hypothetical protein